MEKATFAAGCFWGIEQNLKNLNGVTSTAVGYMGGQTENPSYEQVCSGNTGHAEVVSLEFNPQVLSFLELVTFFFNLHDPTTLNQQGPDIGSQYRSAIYFHNLQQQTKAQEVKDKLQSNFKRTIVTEITEASVFYRAEEYHQCYLEKKGIGSCN